MLVTYGSSTGLRAIDEVSRLGAIVGRGLRAIVGMRLPRVVAV